MERRIGVRGIAYKGGKLLSVRHKGRNGETAEYWSIPGGGLDPAEQIEQGVTREMLEETGIMPKVGRLLFVQQFIFPMHTGELREHLEFFFHLENPGDYETIDLAITTHGEQELAEIAWIDPSTSNVRPAFLQTMNLDEYLSTGKPVYIWNELPLKEDSLDIVDPTVHSIT